MSVCNSNTLNDNGIEMAINATDRNPGTAKVPAIADFRHDGEVLISFQDLGPDEFGRRKFFAFWIDDNVGPHLNEHGVRGQVFFTCPAEFITRQQTLGGTVRIIGGDTRSPAP
ncbi:hypothetical protein MAHJHV63_51430 [Mycobacterium avium subsp. hominissuis]